MNDTHKPELKPSTTPSLVKERLNKMSTKVFGGVFLMVGVLVALKMLGNNKPVDNASVVNPEAKFNSVADTIEDNKK